MVRTRQALREYRRKRDPHRTPEPFTSETKLGARPMFVVQKHAARRLHYDFRLELDGTLKSWSVPKGPSLDPREKRLAVHVEDHPIDYAEFEGVIPKGQYGAGSVLIWDRGRWLPDGDPARAYKAGKLEFRLEGEKLRGGWRLVRMHGRDGDRENWLLIKRDDEAARRGREVVDAAPQSVVSGRAIDAIGRGPSRVWHSTGKAPPALGAAAAKLPGAKRASLPRRTPPQLATLVAAVPDGDDWLHEIKYDGYRACLRLDRGKVQILTRNALDWTARFRPIAEAVAVLPADRAMLDGEIAVVQEDGVTSFDGLQLALSTGRDDGLCCFLFDLLHVDGVDLTGVALESRKALLQELLARAHGAGQRLRYSDHVIGAGAAFYAAAAQRGLEGVVSKRRDAPYRSERNRDWQKTKTELRQEFVIGGFTEPGGSQPGFGSLLLGVHRDAGLRYAGRVGTGFAVATLKSLRRRLDRLERRTSPFADPVPAPRGVHWVRPELVAEVRFRGWTRQGILRHPSFQGLREDKPARDVVPERPVAPDPPPRRARADAASRDGGADDATVAGVRLTNPDRILFAEQGVTKLALARYYENVAGRMLPHLRGRPLTLLRCPRGAGQPCFFQKHPNEAVPDVLHRVPIREKQKSADYLYVEDVAGLVALVQVGALEIHVWGSRVGDGRRGGIERPDQIVLDLDPGPDVDWPRVVAAAFDARALLAKAGLRSWVKTTGGKGLHVVTPIEPVHDWDEVKRFAHAIAQEMVHASPAEYVAVMTKARRRGRIFVDYLRNGRGASAIAPYSTRARPHAPISVPVAWRQLGPELRSDHFTLARLPPARDPWRGFFTVAQRLPRGAKR